MTKQLWTLRSGDLLPESLDDILLRSGDCKIYPNREFAVRELAKAGNLFESEQEAAEASLEVRMALKRLRSLREERQLLGRRLYKNFDNNQSLADLTSCFEKLAGGRGGILCELLLRILQIFSGHNHDNFQANGQESPLEENQSHSYHS